MLVEDSCKLLAHIIQDGSMGVHTDDNRYTNPFEELTNYLRMAGAYEHNQELLATT